MSHSREVISSKKRRERETTTENCRGGRETEGGDSLSPGPIQSGSLGGCGSAQAAGSGGREAQRGSEELRLCRNLVARFVGNEMQAAYEYKLLMKMIRCFWSGGREATSVWPSLPGEGAPCSSATGRGGHQPGGSFSVSVFALHGKQPYVLLVAPVLNVCNAKMTFDMISFD